MKPIINFEDFAKLDIRVGKVLTVVAPEWSRKLLELTVDFGEEIGQRTILAGIKEWYQPEDIEGKTMLFLVNLEEKKMGQGVSQGMMIAADDGQKAIVIELPDDLKAGTIIR